MAYDYLGGILEIANVIISLFVLIYAWSFLRQTADVRDRKPWVYLFIAAAVFFLFEVLGVLDVFNFSNIPNLRSFLESAFIALILFVFIFQYDLILKSDLILITRKIAREEGNEEAEAKLISEKLKSPISEHIALVGNSPITSDVKQKKSKVKQKKLPVKKVKSKKGKAAKKK
jgi:hypothetical protein